MNTVLFVNATIGFSENLFLVCLVMTIVNFDFRYIRMVYLLNITLNLQESLDSVLIFSDRVISMERVFINYQVFNPDEKGI